uniref:Uncharacterized LOC107574117 n=1 Tax=Sinocyclocheilus grahami TaxID=75366 RepID=A0A672L399_SINGR
MLPFTLHFILLFTEIMEHLHTSLILLPLFCSLSAGKSFFTHLGTRCIDDCKSDSGVFKCKTFDKDGTCQEMYCSPQENMDYWGRQCEADSMCGRHGQDYYWCKINIFTWGYCGLVMENKNHYGSHTGALCYDYCDKREEDYYWCHTVQGWDYYWDYCSPDVDVTYKGKPCRSYHSCGPHDYNYNWCWTSESEYDYCGPVESGECTYITSRHRNRRAPDDKVVICTKMDKGNKKITTFTAKPAPNAIADGSQWRNEAENLISRWENNYLVDQARSNLIHSDNLRIDMQGIINHNNQLYHNLQIQVNVRRRSGQSTTVSQIIVPRGIPRRYIRRALLESFRRRARVLIEVSTLNQC